MPGSTGSSERVKGKHLKLVPAMAERERGEGEGEGEGGERECVGFLFYCLYWS